VAGGDLKKAYIKRVMSEVFPTLCSPRKTSLNFWEREPDKKVIPCFLHSDALLAAVTIAHLECSMSK
jgi:hypothetical protein